MSGSPELPLRFDCPACGAVLTVPATLAGMQGPCPKCWQEIVSPDPAHGLEARLPSPPLATVPEPQPPAVPDEAPPVPAPAAQDIAPPTEPPPVAPPRKSRVRLPLLIGVPALVLAGIGYHFGKGFRPRLVEPVTASLPAATPPSPTPEAEAPLSDTPPQAPPDTPQANAEAALVAFLGSPDWLARSAFVLAPEDVRPAMEKHAKEHGDGTIPASAIQLLEAAPPVFVFKVCTKNMPDGFPVPVTLTGDGPKIDWESFTAFNDDHFRKLLTGPVDQAGILDLLVKPEAGEEPSPHYSRYRLSVPMPGREATAWVRKDSVALARLKSVFDGANGYDKSAVEAMVAESGVPLRLAVAKRRTNDGREYLELVDLVAVGWARTTP